MVNSKIIRTYRITGYFRSRNFCITHAKLNFEGFIFIHFQLQDNLSIRDLLSKSFIFEGVVLFKIFENKTPSKITRYTVDLRIQNSWKPPGPAHLKSPPSVDGGKCSQQGKTHWPCKFKLMSNINL